VIGQPLISICQQTRSCYYGEMKTTLDLPDDLMRAVKIRAAEENRKLKDLIAELLRRGLAQQPEAPAAARQRVRLPLVQCAHEARPGEEMTPERVAEVLIEEEAGGPRVALR
jgi:plasmid stability protein